MSISVFLNQLRSSHVNSHGCTVREECSKMFRKTLLRNSTGNFEGEGDKNMVLKPQGYMAPATVFDVLLLYILLC